MQSTILVIDDQWSMQELTRVILQAAGYRVILADDGIVGLALARTELPDAIIVDLRLPEMDGVEVWQELHRLHHTAEIPVIFITPEHREEQPLEGPFAGLSTFLQKPFPSGALVQQVANVLHAREMPLAG